MTQRQLFSALNRFLGEKYLIEHEFYDMGVFKWISEGFSEEF